MQGISRKKVGVHVSVAGGLYHAPENAAKIGARAFALFTRNQRRWASPPLQPEEIRRFREHCRKREYAPEDILPHDSYLINLANPDPVGLKKSREAFIGEIRRCEALGLNRLNFHPGSHRNRMNEAEGIARIGESVNRALDVTGDCILVMENTAGMGGQLGWRFEHLAALLETASDRERVGVCLDTCHLFAAGYDLRTERAYQKTFDEFDRTVGFRYLRGMHLNDSRVSLGGRVDRHESLGEGELGWLPFRLIMEDPRMDGIPLVLETPRRDLWPEEIRRLYGFGE